MRAGSVECDLNRPLPPSSFSWITKYTTFNSLNIQLLVIRDKKRENPDEIALSRHLRVLIKKKKKTMNSMYKNGIVQQGH